MKAYQAAALAGISAIAVWQLSGCGDDNPSTPPPPQAGAAPSPFASASPSPSVSPSPSESAALQWSASSEVKRCRPNAGSNCRADYRFFVNRSGEFFVAPLPGGTFTQSGNLSSGERAELNVVASQAAAQDLSGDARCTETGAMPGVRELHVELSVEDSSGSGDSRNVAIYDLSEVRNGDPGRSQLCVIGEEQKAQALASLLDRLAGKYIVFPIQSPTPRPTPSATVSATPSPTQTASPTSSPTVSVTPSVSASASPTETSTPSPSVSASETPSPSPSPSPSSS